MQQLFARSFTKKPPFGHSKNGKWFFRPKKIKTSLGNIVCDSNMHPCAQYEIIWTNYAMNVAIRLIIWLENHWSPNVIARFCEYFFNIIAVLQVYFFPGNLVTYNDTMRRFSNFLFFFEFYARFKMRSKGRAWPFLASGWILENFWCFYDKIDTYVPINDFWKK